MADDTIIPEERIPEKLPSEQDLIEIKAIYSGLVTSVKGFSGCTDNSETVEGPLKAFSVMLARLKELTGGQDYDHFMPDTRTNKSGKAVCFTKDLYAQKDNLIGILRSKFLPDEKPHFETNDQLQPAMYPPLNLYLTQFTSQVTEVNHEVEVQVTNNIKVTLAAKLDEQIQKYPEGSKERTFMSKLKDGLSSAKDFAGLMGLALTTAQSVGLGYDKLHGLLKALGLM